MDNLMHGKFGYIVLALALLIAAAAIAAVICNAANIASLDLSYYAN